jgi:hypothetical protein
MYMIAGGLTALLVKYSTMLTRSGFSKQNKKKITEANQKKCFGWQIRKIASFACQCGRLKGNNEQLLLNLWRTWSNNYFYVCCIALSGPHFTSLLIKVLVQPPFFLVNRALGVKWIGKGIDSSRYLASDISQTAPH